MTAKTTFRLAALATMICFASLAFAQQQHPFGLSKPQGNPNAPNNGIGLANNPNLNSQKPAGKKGEGVMSRDKTPFPGHIDVDLMAFKPSISCQNMEPGFATYSIFYNDLGNFMATGMSSSAGIFDPGKAIIALSTDLLFHDDFGPELMRLQYSTGALGIGTPSPNFGSKLHVQQDLAVYGNGLIYSQSNAPVGTFSDIAGVYGQNNVDEFYGVGVRGNGGWQGVIGEVYPTGSNSYFGVSGSVLGGSGTNYGVYGSTFGSGTNYGVYGTAIGGTDNFAGYFDGIVRNNLFRSNLTAYKWGIDLAAIGTGGSYSGITGRYPDLADQGAGIFFADNSSGINIGDPAGINWHAVNASAFNISSDRNVKKDITPVASTGAAVFMQQLRAIESATYWYKNEDKQHRPVPHVGVIAQSLPAELQTQIDATANGISGEKNLGVSLGDWLGLVTIGVKENDRRLLEMEAANKELVKENEALKAKLQSIEEKLLLLEKLLK